MNDLDAKPRAPASSPCMAAGTDPHYAGLAAIDPQQTRDVAIWRKAERQRLLAQRADLSLAHRQGLSDLVAAHIDRYLVGRFGSVTGLTVSAWWPIKAELNLRTYLTDLVARGITVALPVVLVPHTPLVFREWTPGCAMVQGFWKIPVPADGPEVVPDIALAPLVGWDGAGYRLGYGGGYFDRTLAALAPRAHAIGVGLNAARLTTIFPQPHDIAMNAIITESGFLQPA